VKIGSEGDVTVVLKAEPPGSPTGIAIRGEMFTFLELGQARGLADVTSPPNSRINVTIS